MKLLLVTISLISVCFPQQSSKGITLEYFDEIFIKEGYNSNFKYLSNFYSAWDNSKPLVLRIDIYNFSKNVFQVSLGILNCNKFGTDTLTLDTNKVEFELKKAVRFLTKNVLPNLIEQSEIEKITFSRQNNTQKLVATPIYATSARYKNSELKCDTQGGRRLSVSFFIDKKKFSEYLHRSTH